MTWQRSSHGALACCLPRKNTLCKGTWAAGHLLEIRGFPVRNDHYR